MSQRFLTSENKSKFDPVLITHSSEDFALSTGSNLDLFGLVTIKNVEISGTAYFFAICKQSALQTRECDGSNVWMDELYVYVGSKRCRCIDECAMNEMMTSHWSVFAGKFTRIARSEYLSVVF